ncbi:osmoprotectant transport system ATP-binding protein [Mumia flava]|uniref:ABC-type quaternary amine transporter n=1 Tax=Mumia flava TaxID=1348852 RepID=A0A0B2BVA6_9ACTN|nr:betaine/proline/choline family ABC transporter ATP-binding protein [Mumia flava]PJJ58105.1 osmoprotectant transport system ATP-binding protein [Mumia flava]
MHRSEDAAIVLDAVGKRYPDGTTAVGSLSLTVPRGELVALVGPSGCGKSTTLKMINRLIEPTSGRIVIDGQDVTKADPVALRRGIGYVIQNVGLFPHQTIRDNVATVPSLLGWKRRRARERVDELLDLVGLEPETFGDRYPHQLSGGQRQRVGVARALAADPPVLLMDEPFGAVDPVVRDRLQDEFGRLQDTLGKTVVFVTHDIDEAVRLGDRVAVLAGGGDLRQYDSPAVVLGDPADDFVAQFVGSERGLRRLAVTPIEAEDLEDPPVVRATSAESAAAAAMDRADLPYALVVDAEDRLRGWVHHEQLRDRTDVRPRRMEAYVGRDASLKEALSVMLRYDAGWVAVLDDDGRLLGVLTPESLHAALRRSIRTTEPLPLPDAG